MLTAQNKSFSEIAVHEGFESNRHGTRVVVIGIDARYVILLFQLDLTHFLLVHGSMNVKYSAVRDISIYKQAKIQNSTSSFISLPPCHGFLSVLYLCLMKFIA